MRKVNLTVIVLMATLSLLISCAFSNSQPTLTPFPIPETSTPDLTRAFANALLTLVSGDATQTFLPAFITPTSIATQGYDSVAATATALATLLLGDDIPTRLPN